VTLPRERQLHLPPPPFTQFNLFTEMPFVFRFPTTLFLLTLLGSILLAVVASCLPARRLARIAIAGVLKGRTSVST